MKVQRNEVPRSIVVKNVSMEKGKNKKNRGKLGDEKTTKTKGKCAKKEEKRRLGEKRG